MTDKTVTVRFFARLREELGTEQLTLAISGHQTVGDLLAELAGRGGPWAQLQGDQPVMIAINQAMAKSSAPIRAGDEVAFFPPVTGG
ncbi:molybdopterin converting factor subunit 1 [Marinobacter sp. S0848L]|uniref:molybdopterin converting factor subunit 1 n=1 Tax=Marinobacter sp. S0848L TaxID=2926423 RepID=UPI001FF5A5B8|nr:molybdopterin converting factor subunit 1 [Marinobacter sp. S0848L]MCK0106636.1 molybdopterin converting factor subunit 1 [Marinobacter sp. S0848L]